MSKQRDPIICKQCGGELTIADILNMYVNHVCAPKPVKGKNDVDE